MSNQADQTIKDKIQECFDLLNEGRHTDAVNLFRSIVEPLPENTEIRMNLANLAMKLGELIDLINIRAQLVADFPDNASYIDDLGQAYLENRMYQDATSCFDKALSINPEMYHPYFGHAYIAVQNGQYTDAINLLKKALELKPSEPSIYINLSGALIMDNRAGEALEYAKKLLRLNPKDPHSYLTMGRILSEMGNFDEAIEQFEKAIRLDRTYGFAYAELSAAKKFTAKDKKFIEQTKTALKQSMAPERRSAINFCLGKIHNDLKEYDQAFQFYKQANLIAKPAVPRNTIQSFYKKTHKIFTRKFLDSYKDQGSESSKPVFIVGMPRSGTTLIERVIAKHPVGAGAGELTTITNITELMCGYEELGQFKQKLEQVISNNQLKDYIDFYLKALTNNREQANRIVDKMPSNFAALGLIQLMFPNAYIINAMRSPLDSCLSCYFQSFANLDWSYDLDWIVEEYRYYRRAMENWKKILPADRIIDVKYEDMVADPEGQSRRIIESIDLEWDPVCLDYHDSDSFVSTASLWQVRQPIYQTSSKRWLKYVNHIEKLARGVKDYLDEEDLKLLAEHGIKIKKGMFASILSR